MTNELPKEYIPYSIRNNITDKDLAGLLDYLEREMGWEIVYSPNNFSYISNSKDPKGVGIFTSFEGDIGIYSQEESRCIEGMNKKVFFRTYKSILPVIRDLYSK